MKRYTDVMSVRPADPALQAEPLRLAVAAYLARFQGSSRDHADSDLRCYLAWCAERGLDPLAARRPHLDLYIRWMREIRRFKPSTVSRRFSAAAGVYWTCAPAGVLQHHPRTTLRYDQARQNLDRHPNYILAAYMASGTSGHVGGPWSADRHTHLPMSVCCRVG